MVEIHALVVEIVIIKTSVVFSGFCCCCCRSNSHNLKNTGYSSRYCLLSIGQHKKNTALGRPLVYWLHRTTDGVDELRGHQGPRCAVAGTGGCCQGELADASQSRATGWTNRKRGDQQEESAPPSRLARLSNLRQATSRAGTLMHLLSM